MADKAIAAGDEIESYCTSCKLMLAHTVVALVGEKVDKVLCKTCGKTHKYRPNPPKSRTKKAATKKKTKTTTKKKTTRSRRKKDPAAKWEEALEGRDLATAKTYAMPEVFEQNQVIEHEQFGPGLVTDLRPDGKMEVLFKDGAKLLVYGHDL